MTVIHKYKIDVHGLDIELSYGSKVLHVAEQFDHVCIWVQIEESLPKRTRSFILIGTGQPFPDMHCEYIGTALCHGGNLVLHVYEVSR